MKSHLVALLTCGMIVGGLVAGVLWGPSPSLAKGPGHGSGDGCSCNLCHDPHSGGGGKLLKPHPYPKNYPLQCFDCHFPHSLVPEPECFSCHECGGEHAGLSDLGCFDCHGSHDPNRAPNFSTQTKTNCFRCHEVTMP